MKTTKLSIVIFLIFAGLFATSSIYAKDTEKETSSPKFAVGTFDSRAVAIAYARSETFMNYIMGLHAELKKAKEEGNEKRIKELETEGPALQELIHKQGFSTWPVDNILEQVKDKIPDIAKEAKVDVIVSKWNIVYQQEGIEFVDVTDLMVKLFNPDEATLDIVKEIKKQAPVSLKELEELGSDY
jgi:hypothetical protein